jgi:hypothetical protein
MKAEEKIERRSDKTESELLVASPPIYRNKKEKPNNIYKMPVPSSRFKSKMMIFCKMKIHKSKKAYS